MDNNNFNKLPQDLLEPLVYNNLQQSIEQLSNIINNNHNIHHQDQKKYSILNKILNLYEQYHQLLQKIKNNNILINEYNNDQDFIQLINDDNFNFQQKRQEIYETFQQLIYQDDNENIDGISLEIRGATGGREAALFANDLLEMYEKFAMRKNWKFSIENLSKTTEGGVKEAVMIIKNKNAYNSLKFESGVHRVQRVPDTESKGRIHTSTATVAVLPLLNEISDIYLDPKDIQIDVYRASGAGGQHVNTTESAVRLTHIPTGTVVIQQDERSQHKNKEKAMGVLKTRVMQKMIQDQMELLCNQRLEQIGKGQRCEKIRTYNFPQDRVTDHRINYSVFNIIGFMNGEELEKICDAMKEASATSLLEKYNLIK
jgi:peptide chain release factor 1